ncbi:MAG: T9SS type A sorting domain-containing protein [Dysgonamonadaceae bacterium]|jgi:hypothetical protein|nr:T9SS type A sorting domain-containing protein [Dysgonamonadaceae bacterium]
MREKKLKLLWVAVLAAIMPIFFNAQAEERLYVYSTDGAVQSFALDDLHKITLTEQDFNILPLTGNVTTFLYDNVSVITFKPKSETAIPVIEKSGLKLFLETDNLRIESDTEMSAVKLYNLQGKLLTNQMMQSLSANISLSSYPAGIYIVQIINQQGTSTYKIIKK